MCTQEDRKQLCQPSLYHLDGLQVVFPVPSHRGVQGCTQLGKQSPGHAGLVQVKLQGTLQKRDDFTCLKARTLLLPAQPWDLRFQRTPSALLFTHTKSWKLSETSLSSRQGSLLKEAEEVVVQAGERAAEHTVLQDAVFA